MPGFVPPGGDSGSGSSSGAGLLTATRELTAEELQALNSASYQILPAAEAGMSWVVHDLYLTRGAGTRLRSLRYNPQLAIVLGPESTTGKLNANSGSENFSETIYSGRVADHLPGTAYVYHGYVSHSLAAGAAVLVGIYGTVQSSEQSRFAAIGGTLAIELAYSSRAVA